MKTVVKNVQYVTDVGKTVELYTSINKESWNIEQIFSLEYKISHSDISIALNDFQSFVFS